MRSGSHVQLTALRNRHLELQTTFGLLSLKRQVIMVQFLSINFFCCISSIFVGFFKGSRFLCLPVLGVRQSKEDGCLERLKRHTQRNSINIPEVLNCQKYRCENLRYRKVTVVVTWRIECAVVRKV